MASPHKDSEDFPLSSEVCVREGKRGGGGIRVQQVRFGKLAVLQ